MDKLNPEDLNLLADALSDLKRRGVVQKHIELLKPIEQAERWAREKYRKVSEDRSRAEKPPQIL